MRQTFDETTDPSFGAKHLPLVRAAMAEQGLDGFLVPHEDEHQNEYLPEANDRLAWLTGFTGSAGAGVVMKDRAAVFTDGRYTVQVKAQVDAGQFELRDLVEGGVPAYLEEAPQGAVIGYDPRLHSPDALATLRRAAAKAGAELKPVETNPRYSGDNGAFSVAYPGEGTAYEVTFDPRGINGVQLKYVGGDTGMLTFFGEPGRNRTPEQVVQEVLKARYPSATIAYEIPNASVGYEPGYGVIADVYPRDTSSTFNRLRVIVMAAIRHDYALIAAASGPYHEFSPDYGPGHPSGANLEVAMDMGKYVNSFKWNGDRYARSS
jgi:hypothetical protein